MSTTFITGKRSFAIRDNSGEIFYLLFEQSCCSSLEPMTPHWDAIYFGQLEGALERIFRTASAFEGGSVRTRSGGTAVGYIDTWLRTLAFPLQWKSTTVSLEAGDGFCSAMGLDKLPKFAELMEQHQVVDHTKIVADMSSGQSVTFNLREHAHVIAAALKELRLSTWRIFRNFSDIYLVADQAGDLGYDPAKGKSTAPLDVPQFAQVNRRHHLMLQDGKFVPVGYAYDAIGLFISNEWRAQLQSPGSYSKRIAAYRQAVTDAVDVTNGRFSVRLDHSAAAAVGRYYGDQVERIKANSGVETDGPVFDILVEDNSELLDQVLRLPAGAAILTMLGEGDGGKPAVVGVQSELSF